jgi:hypothetical protein
MTRSKSIAWLWGLVIVFLVAGFQTHHIHATQMREDEEIAYRSTQYDVAYTVRFQAERDVHAPLWFASFWLWQQFMGDSEFIGRVYSIFLSMMTMALAYQIGKRWFGTARYGLFAITVLGTNAYFFIYSLEIRPYAMVMLAATVSMWLFWRWLNEGTWRAAMWYGLAVGMMLYLHYFLFFLVIVQGIYFLWFALSEQGKSIELLQKSTRHENVNTRLRPFLNRMMRQGAGASVVAFSLWLPWLPVLVGQMLTLRRLEAVTARGVGIANTTEPTSVAAIFDLVQVTTNGQPGLYALALLIGLIYLWRRWGYRLALLWGVGVPVIALALNVIASVYTQRYITYLAVGLALAVGAGLAMSGELIQKLLNRKDDNNPKITSVFALVGFVAISLWALPSQFPTGRIPYRDLLKHLSTAAQAGDVIFFDHADHNDNFAQWQYRHYLTPELLDNAVTNKDSATDARRIWHITAHWFDADVRANFADIEWTHPRQSGFGNCDLNWCYLIQLMEAPPWNEPVVVGEDMAFWGVDVDSVNRDEIQTRLWWRVEQAPSLNYSMSLQLLDAAGRLVSQADGPINHYGAEIVETSQLELGRVYIDHRIITLPPDLLPGEYRLALVVYQSWDGVRLLLLDGSDTLMVHTIIIP